MASKLDRVLTSGGASARRPKSRHRLLVCIFVGKVFPIDLLYYYLIVTLKWFLQRIS